MKHHDHDHAHGDPHAHGHETLPPHRHSREGGNPETAPNGTHGATHHHRMDSRLRGNDGTWTAGLLMTSSWSRVLGALALIALLWLAVAWAVLTP
ncbi:MAG: hypothetical protein RIS44_407 [Pseudomonadota bacterium]|jgi:hypothetical protein